MIALPLEGSVLRCAAVQLHALLGDVDANLAACDTAVAQAASDGARVVALPEFFTSGVAFSLDVVQAAQSVDGPAVQTLLTWAKTHDVAIAGSLLIRDPDGHVRNAHLLVGPSGLLGRHDKDLPTMWENALYAPGHDDGLLHAPLPGSDAAEPVGVGMALCWELTRSGTVRRLTGQVDLVLAGSGWWSIPDWRPRRMFAAWEQANSDRARQAPAEFARLVGAPVVHAAHVGEFECPLPGLPGRYRGRYEGGTGMWDSSGSEIAALPSVSSGPGTATAITADVRLGRGTSSEAPAQYWLTPPGPVPTFAWHWQRAVGRPFYRRHVQRAPARRP